MTVVLAVLLAVAVVLAVLLAVVALRRGRLAARARAEAAGTSERLAARSAELARAEQDRRAADSRVGAAEGRLRAAEQRASDAEKRAGEAERRVGEVMRRAEEAERAGAGSAAAAVWELERLRVGREWVDVAGPGVDLPIPWDGTVAPVVATELSVIREVIGTPSDLSVSAPARPSSPARVAVAARVCVEMLRLLARSGAEMEVVLEGDTLVVSQPVYEGDTAPELGDVARVAAAAGLALTVDVAADRSVARLTVA